MTGPADLTWALLFVGAALSSLRSSPAWAARPDPLATLVAGALLALACVLAAASASPG
jgi:hypothetical protein